jgi:acyl-CoA thioester hydrolase
MNTTQVRVRYAETDKMGVVYYANYLVWFEIGRVELLRSLGFDYRRMEVADDCHLPVVDAHCRYRASALYDDLITIETRFLTLRGSVLKFGYRILRASGIAPPDHPEAGMQLLAEGETVHVICDRHMQRTILPERYAAPIRDSIRDSIGDSIGDSIRDSIRDSPPDSI